jgi:2-polyprenyl-3-methyl-5-hydroxy-6-metoxy-1,4-benzoquinol methylase
MLRALAKGLAKTPEALAEECHLSPFATGKMVRALSALGLVEARGEAYLMAPAMAALFQPDDADLSFFLEHSHDMYDGWGANLERWVRDESWQTRQRDAAGRQRFGQAMRAMGTHVARRVAAALDLDGVARMLDIGGGVGHFAEAFVRRAPGIQATVLDVPEVAEMGRQRVAASDLAEQIRFVGGDYTETETDRDYDLALLANVLHQEREETAKLLVSRAARATRSSGRVVVVDFSIDSQKRENPIGALFAINMRSFGDTYPADVIESWMTDAGLVTFQREDLGPHRWILSSSKP